MIINTYSQMEAEQLTPEVNHAWIAIQTPPWQETQYPQIDTRRWWGRPALVLSFHDADLGLSEPVPNGCVPFTTEHAHQIIDFVKRHKDVERLNVSCWAGLARSQAVARFIFDFQLVLGMEEAELRIVADHSRMNKYVYKTLESVIMESQ